MQGKAVRELLAHRLSPRSSQEAKTEWYEIVEGQHQLWDGVSEPYKHTIRAFLVHFHTQILRASSERFSFRNGSVGQSVTMQHVVRLSAALAGSRSVKQNNSCSICAHAHMLPSKTTIAHVLQTRGGCSCHSRQTDCKHVYVIATCQNELPHWNMHSTCKPI